MTDIETAKAHLQGHSICLCRDGAYFTDDGRGISPMMKLIAENCDLTGYSVADVIVGKAAAMLFVKAGIVEVYGEVLSADAKDFFEQRSVPCSYGTLTDKIINRAGDDICPMEKAVKDIEDENEGYRALCQRLKQMKHSH